jgi:hypothetical protein
MKNLPTRDEYNESLITYEKENKNITKVLAWWCSKQS